MMSDQPTRKKAKNEIHVHPQTKRFARYFDYTPNDLLFNREGFLSPRQTQRLRHAVVGTLGLRLLAIMGVSIVIAYLMSGQGAEIIIETKGGFFADWSDLAPLEWMFLIGGIVLLVLFVLMVRDILTFRHDIKNGRVVPLVGPAHRRRREYKNRATRQKEFNNHIEIAHQEYNVDDELYKLCEQNLIYCAYISVATNQIIAMEVVDESVHDMPEWMREAFESISVDDFKSQVDNRMLL